MDCYGKSGHSGSGRSYDVHVRLSAQPNEFAESCGESRSHTENHRYEAYNLRSSFAPRSEVQRAHERGMGSCETFEEKIDHGCRISGKNTRGVEIRMMFGLPLSKNF